ncbi:putative membrane protein [Caldicoprobacter guelmensis]|uniref:QueT transporter family protein n=1 Tax=Caldicoprobacter guelmensis TaxID=1170224 RepID=UPI00195B27C0|nr:putative membrane protein [Caldicoprobacter guelmensis]
MKGFKISPRFVARAGIIAAVYTVLTLALQGISYGPVQFRVAEALTVLPFVDPAAIPGVALGCMFANLGSPLGWVDIVGGSFITLISAYLTHKAPNRYVALLPPIVLNALGVPIYLAPAVGMPYWLVALQVGLGQLVVIGVLGLPVLSLYERMMNRFFIKD